MLPSRSAAGAEKVAMGPTKMVPTALPDGPSSTAWPERAATVQVGEGELMRATATNSPVDGSLATAAAIAVERITSNPTAAWPLGPRNEVWLRYCRNWALPVVLVENPPGPVIGEGSLAA